MDVEKLRSLRVAHPFQPFYLLLEDGEKILVEKPLHFGMAPDESRMGVALDEGMRILSPTVIKDAMRANELT